MKKSIIAIAMLLAWTGISHASVVVTNGLTHTFDLSSGASQKGYIMLHNVGDKPQRVLVYKNDLEVNCTDENIAVKETSNHERSNASWINLGMNERVLAPGEKYSLVYEVKAPEKELSGSYWSLIMVEVKKPIDTSAAKSGVKVSSNIRYAVQIISNFATSTIAEVKFENVGYSVLPQGKALEVTLNNQGDRMMNPKVKLEVYDGNGEVVYTKFADSKKLYPEQCRKFEVLLDGLEVGDYQAVLIADCGESDLFGMTINLEVNE